MNNKKSYIFNEPITDIINKRISVRTYDSKLLEDNLKKELTEYLSKLNGPLNSKVKLKLIDSDAALNSNIKLGTYGIIRGVSSFVASSVNLDDASLLQLGYELESFILYATSLGLGTCWLGGTFKKSEFAKAMELKQDEILPIVTPVGYIAKSEGLVGSLMRTLAGSKNRKAFEELFFNKDFDNNFTLNEDGGYKDALEMVRLAPSASNKQPWRIVKDGDNLHFYLSHTKGYAKGLGFDMQKIDIGIAMCHLDLTMKEEGMEGKWEQNNPNIKKPNEDIEYMISWIKTN